MKKALFLLSGLFLTGIACIIFASLSCNSNTGNTQTNAIMRLSPEFLKGEDSLNVTGDTIHVTSVNNRFTLKDTCLYIAINGRLT